MLGAVVDLGDNWRRRRDLGDNWRRRRDLGDNWRRRRDLGDNWRRRRDLGGECSTPYVCWHFSIKTSLDLERDW